MDLMAIFGLVNFFFAVVIGLYFWNLLRTQQVSRSAVERESRKELEKLNRLKAIKLSEPLAEKTRPTSLEDIIGQEDGLKALRAALCGPNPQHVIIYGPPGVGKTAAARVVLEEAKKSQLSPFRESAKFVEVDATTARFDERGIADPLMGSVHDPIYQGAGPMGIAGIPQPKPGAVTKAHGGILFIDEIGELHPIQMNKLLKVLEDRKVFLESAYYSSEDTNIPAHIHDIFQNGLPADFRLVGATTRSPEEIPPAIRSRCLEVFFRPLTSEQIRIIAKGACRKTHFGYDEEALDVLVRYAKNGREAVNMVQLAAGIALSEKRTRMTKSDIEWVVQSGHYQPRPEEEVPSEPQIGCVNALAVYGANMGTLITVEASALEAEKGKGTLKITGVIDEEEIGASSHRVRRKSMVKESVENVLTVLQKHMGVHPRDYDIHINFPGAIPLDGPSAGVAIATAVYSAITERPVDNYTAMTGEVSLRGIVKPVGGIFAKVEAAMRAGARRVLIPKENWQDAFDSIDTPRVIPVTRIEDVIAHATQLSEEDEVPMRSETPALTLSIPAVNAGRYKACSSQPFPATQDNQ